MLIVSIWYEFFAIPNTKFGLLEWHRKVSSVFFFYIKSRADIFVVVMVCECACVWIKTHASQKLLHFGGN